MRKTSLNTKYSYSKNWQRFAAWCKARGFSDCPASGATIAEYVDHLSAQGKNIGVINQAISAIHYAHSEAGHASMTSSIPARAALSRARRQSHPTVTLKTMCI